MTTLSSSSSSSSSPSLPAHTRTSEVVTRWRLAGEDDDDAQTSRRCSQHLSRAFSDVAFALRPYTHNGYDDTTHRRDAFTSDCRVRSASVLSALRRLTITAPPPPSPSPKVDTVVVADMADSDAPSPVHHMQQSHQQPPPPSHGDGAQVAIVAATTTATAVTADAAERLHRKRKGFLSQIAATPSIRAIRFIGWALCKVWDAMFTKVWVNKSGLDELHALIREVRRHQDREGGSGPTLLLLPTHKSHMDYLLLSWLTFRHNLPMPFIAAGDNLARLPLVGRFFRRCGAFYIKRGRRHKQSHHTQPRHQHKHNQRSQPKPQRPTALSESAITTTSPTATAEPEAAGATAGTTTGAPTLPHRACNMKQHPLPLDHTSASLLLRGNDADVTGDYDTNNGEHKGNEGDDVDKESAGRYEAGAPSSMRSRSSEVHRHRHHHHHCLLYTSPSPRDRG